MKGTQKATKYYPNFSWDSQFERIGCSYLRRLVSRFMASKASKMPMEMTPKNRDMTTHAVKTR